MGHWWDPLSSNVVVLVQLMVTEGLPVKAVSVCVPVRGLGGVTLLRAAAKNHNRVTVVCDPADYERYDRYTSIDVLTCMLF